jgi:hypothetical protein
MPVNNEQYCIKFCVSGEWFTIQEEILIKTDMNKKTNENEHANKEISSQRQSEH